MELRCRSGWLSSVRCCQWGIVGCLLLLLVIVFVFVPVTAFVLVLAVFVFLLNA